MIPTPPDSGPEAVSLMSQDLHLNAKAVRRVILRPLFRVESIQQSIEGPGMLVGRLNGQANTG